MSSTIRANWRCLREGDPGHRFRALYEQRRRNREGGSAARHVVPIALGVVLILAGIAVGWVPGPGGFIGIFGVALLATEFKPLAKLLDWTELRLRAAWRVLWQERSAPARVLIGLCAVGIAAGAVYAAGLLLLG
jgi:hypothetical protein